MARFLYTCLFYLITPFVALRLLLRSRLAPAYRQRWRERFGVSPRREGHDPAIWVHSVSVGETLAALPMMRALLERYPEHQLIVTTMTPTGSERVQVSLAAELEAGRVLHCYAPYDLPHAVSSFLSRTRPDLAIVMETELWPNTIAACAARNIPVVLANARLSEKSARGYGKLSALARPMLQQLNCVAAQHAGDAERFGMLGVDDQQLHVTGNIKFDLNIDEVVQAKAAEFRQRWCSHEKRVVWLAASTHEGEDAQVLQAFGELLKNNKVNPLLVLVPRHPERFERVAELAAKQFAVQRHSEGGPLAADTQVLIGDTMGEMMALLGASDVCFMGGTLVKNGGHNFIEPAAWGVPQVSGPSLFNFAEVSRLLIEAGGLQMVHTPAQLAATVATLCSDEPLRQALGAAGKEVAEANRGALERLLAHIDGLLPVK